jgi:hypothetical protein
MRDNRVDAGWASAFFYAIITILTDKRGHVASLEMGL